MPSWSLQSGGRGLDIRQLKETTNNLITTVLSAMQDERRVPGEAGAERTDLGGRRGGGS